MNTTIAKVIAFELGVLIAILAWLAAAGLPAAKRGETAAATVQRPADESFGSVAPVYHPQPQQFYATNAVDYPNDSYSDDDTSQSQAVQTYDQPIANAPYAATFPEDYSDVQEAPNSIGTFPEPVLYSPYDWPSNPYFGYAQPAQIIVLSNGRFCAHRGANSPHFNRSRPIAAPRRPHPANLHAGGGTRVISHLPVVSHGMPGAVVSHRMPVPQRTVAAGVSHRSSGRVLASR